MVEKKQKTSPSGFVATLLGDVVGSRTSTDRRGLHAHLSGRLDELTDLLRSEEQASGMQVLASPLRITTGDEYQGTFVRVGGALTAARWLRLALLPAPDEVSDGLSRLERIGFALVHASRLVSRLPRSH